MSASHIIGNRNSTPESSSSTLRPPGSRSIMPPNHHLRASADVSSLASAGGLGREIRPASEVYYNQHQRAQSHADPESSMDRAAQQWIADIDQYENTLEEMAAATLDQDFKDELSAIEQWFRVLSEAERTAALYALLQQATQVQTRFFVGVLQEMAKNHPMSGILSPSSFGEKDPMANRLSSAMNRLSVGGDRNSASLGRPPPSPNTKRNSGLDQHEINSMFPDAAAAIAKQKAEFESRTGTVPTSNRNSTVDRTSFVAPTISAPQEDKKEGFAQPSPWGRSTDRPKSSSGQQPMGQFAQPPPSSTGLRSPRAMPLGTTDNIQSTSINAPGLSAAGLDVLSPYHGSGNWASMVNTPMVPNFQQDQNQANMVASATAMKLAAMSTVNKGIQLDDVRKYRRARSSEGGPLSPGVPGIIGPNGQGLNAQQMAALQSQQMNAFQQSRSRPSSPGLAFQGSGPTGMNYAGAQQNGFLSAFDANPAILTNGMPSLNMGHHGGEGYLSDASEINRGRSPRGRRGNSRPPEDPTDIELLNDIPAWLRSLRLHKYTDILKDYKWQELVEMDDATLEARGVNALGARRKLLKVFSDVKEKQAQGKY